MKNINITNIVDPTSLQPFTGNSLKFLQDASSEARAGMIKAFITQNLGSYSLTVPYVISGCVYSGTTPNFAVTAGEIFYGGEYYELTAVSGYTNIPQFKLDQTQDVTADPLDFSDGQTHNVHDIFKFIGEDTVTAKVFDATDLVSAYGSGKVNTFLSAGTSVISSTSWADLSGASYTTPNDGVTRTYSIVGKTNNNFIASSGASDGGGLKLVVDGVDQDESFGRLANSGGDVTTVNLTSTVISTITVAPNKVIKLQVKSVSGGSVSVEFGRLSISEL